MSQSIFSKYKNKKHPAWLVIADYSIHSMPVKLMQIFEKDNVPVVKHHKTFSQLDENGWKVFYNTEEDVATTRFHLACELGHIFLGHVLFDAPLEDEYKIFSPSHQEQTEAERFAESLLAPACVLWELHLHTAKEIASLCEIPLSVAAQREKRMKTLYQRNKFLISQEEQFIYAQFYRYLQKGKNL